MFSFFRLLLSLFSPSKRIIGIENFEAICHMPYGIWHMPYAIWHAISQIIPSILLEPIYQTEILLAACAIYNEQIILQVVLLHVFSRVHATL